MGRHRLTAKIDFRLPEDVANSWKLAAKDLDLSVADWLRQQIKIDGVDPVVTNRPTPLRRHAEKSCDDPLAREVCRIGNNLNQLAHWANTYKNEIETARVMSGLKNIFIMLEELKNDAV